MTRARDALAAERRRMPWMAVEKTYAFDGPSGKASLLDLFDGRRQLIVYRAFFEPGVIGWPEHACRGCSMVADQVAHVAHLNARDTTLAFVSRAPQADIARLKARMGWEMIPWYTITDSFDADFGVDEWHGTNVFIRDGEQDLPHLLHQQPRRRADGGHLELPRHHAARPPGGVGRLARGLSADADRTNGGTGTTATSQTPRPTRDGSRCRTPARPPFRKAAATSREADRERGYERHPGAASEAARAAGAASLYLAAAPTFAVMALLTIPRRRSPDTLCSRHARHR